MQVARGPPCSLPSKSATQTPRSGSSPRRGELTTVLPRCRPSASACRTSGSPCWPRSWPRRAATCRRRRRDHLQRRAERDDLAGRHVSRSTRHRSGDRQRRSGRRSRSRRRRARAAWRRPHRRLRGRVTSLRGTGNHRRSRARRRRSMLSAATARTKAAPSPPASPHRCKALASNAAQLFNVELHMPESRHRAQHRRPAPLRDRRRAPGDARGHDRAHSRRAGNRRPGDPDRWTGAAFRGRSSLFDHFDPDLTLHGLQLIYDRVEARVGIPGQRLWRKRLAAASEPVGRSRMPSEFPPRRG